MQITAKSKDWYKSAVQPFIRGKKSVKFKRIDQLHEAIDVLCMVTGITTDDRKDILNQIDTSEDLNSAISLVEKTFV